MIIYIRVMDKRKLTLLFVVLMLICSYGTYSQRIKLDTSAFEAINVSVFSGRLNNKQTLKVIKDSTVRQFDEPTFAKLTGPKFKNGTIEVKLLSKLLPDAPEFARGFIGVAFRINDSNTRFEGIYIRPTNGRSDNQLRRNRAIQYFSFPDYKFDRLRRESPGEYESYADMTLNEWINLKIVVKDSKARLYINNSKQPSLIVNDLKHGSDVKGAIGLWVDIGTEGCFSDLKITPED